MNISSIFRCHVLSLHDCVVLRTRLGCEVLVAVDELLVLRVVDEAELARQRGDKERRRGTVGVIVVAVAALAEHNRADRHTECAVLFEQLFGQNFGRAAVLIRDLRQRFRTAGGGVCGVVVDAEEQVCGVLIALHDRASQRQVAAIFEGIAHHDNVDARALKVALQVFRNREVDVLLVVGAVQTGRADVAAAVAGVDDNGHFAVDLRGARRLDRVVRLALARGVAAHAREIVRADVAARAVRGVHQMRPAVRDAVHNDLRAVRQLTDLFAGGRGGGPHSELAFDVHAVPAGRKRFVRGGAAVVVGLSTTR